MTAGAEIGGAIPHMRTRITEQKHVEIIEAEAGPDHIIFSRSIEMFCQRGCSRLESHSIIDRQHYSQMRRSPKDNRLMRNGMFWLARSGAGWEDRPDRYGAWKTVYSRFANSVMMAPCYGPFSS